MTPNFVCSFESAPLELTLQSEVDPALDLYMATCQSCGAVYQIIFGKFEERWQIKALTNGLDHHGISIPFGDIRMPEDAKFVGADAGSATLSLKIHDPLFDADKHEYKVTITREEK